MDTKSLISAATAFLQSPAGQKILIKSLNLAPEVIETFKDVRELKKLIDENTPIINTFSTKGRIYNKSTGEPIAGVEVKPLLALYPMKLVTKTRKVKIADPDGGKNILGKPKTIKVEEEYKEYVFDSDNVGKKILTDEKGEYNIRFGVPTLPNSSSPLVKPIVLYNKEQLAPATQTLITQGNEVLGELPIKAMVNIEDEAKEQEVALKQEANNVADKAASIALSAVEQSLLAVKAKILSFASVIQNKLFPLAIGLLIIFGITKLASKNIKKELEEGRCPDDSLLKEAIKRRNSIVKQINQIWIVIAANTAIAAIFLYLTTQLKLGKIQISSLAFPLSVPPGVGVPFSLTALLEDIKELFEQLGDINKELRKAILISLVFLLISLIIILRYLKKIDGLIEKCSIDSADVSMEEINDELLNIQQSDESQGSPTIKIVNGFIMNVVSDTQNAVSGIYRRYATASNSQGIVILKGEPSFSAADPILIDELSFYIIQNNLKAD